MAADNMLTGQGDSFQNALDDVMARRKSAGLTNAVHVVDHQVKPTNTNSHYVHTVTVDDA